MILWIIIAGVLSAFIYYFVIKQLWYWKQRGVKQSLSVPFIGDGAMALLGFKTFADMVIEMYNTFPGERYVGIYQFNQAMLMITDPELLKMVTVKDFDHFADHRTFVPEDVDPLWAKNLLALTGKRWRDMRATLSPTFTSSKMKLIYTLMEEASRDFVKYYEQQNEEIITVELKETFRRYATDVIASTAFGIKCDSLKEKENEFYLMGKEATNFQGFWNAMKFIGYIMIPTIYRALKVKIFSTEVRNFFQGLITDTIRVRQEKNIVRPDMIHLLMEAQKGNVEHEENSNEIETGFATVMESDIGKKKMPKTEVTIEDITAQAMIFFLAGFDTVSGVMCNMSYELAVSPECQDKLRAEIRETLKNCNGKLTYEALLKMKYMDMIVSETMRKWPSLLATDRICTKDYVIQPTRPGEVPVHLKAGMIISLPIYAIHRDPQYYPNPEKFDPERFSDENKGNIKPYTYLPFGAGPRNCIGSRFGLLEVKIAMFHLLNKFEIVPVEKSVIPMVLTKQQFNLTSKDGYWFGLKKINV